MTRFSFGLLVVIPEILPNHSIIHSQAQDIIKGYPRWGNSRHLILLSPRVCSAWWIYGAQARCSNSFQQVFSNFLPQIYQQIGFLCHVNLYTITSTVVPRVWNETQLLGWCRAGKSLVTFAADRLCLFTERLVEHSGAQSILVDCLPSCLFSRSLLYFVMRNCALFFCSYQLILIPLFST